MLNQEELQRYDRQLLLPEVGLQGQEKLKATKAMIAGAGGLGSSVALYLAAAGVGSLRLVDHDVVERSNLNRQVLHWDQDIQTSKVISAQKKIQSFNPEVSVEPRETSISEETLPQLVEGCHILVDVLDNFSTRYVLNKRSLDSRLPLFHGAISRFEGEVTTIIPGKTACLRCRYKGFVPEDTFPVIGVAPGIIGNIQACEVIKYIVGAGELLLNRLMRYDGLKQRFTEFSIKPNPCCDHCGQGGG